MSYKFGQHGGHGDTIHDQGMHLMREKQGGKS